MQVRIETKHGIYKCNKCHQEFNVKIKLHKTFEEKNRRKNTSKFLLKSDVTIGGPEILP